MGEYDGVRPQDDFGHAQDDDLSDYQPGMGAMVAMGYEPGSSQFEAFDMGHTWSPDMLPGMPHGPFDEPDKMGWEHPRYQRRGFWDRLFGRGVGWKDEFGDDTPDPDAGDYVTDYVTEEDVVDVPQYVDVPYYTTYVGGSWGRRRRARPGGWAAWGHPASPGAAGRYGVARRRR